MGKMKIDFSDVEGFEALPEGSYPVTVQKVEVRESKSSEHNYLNWELKIDEGEEGAGRLLWMITSLSPRALFRLKEVFETLGVYDEEMELDWDDDVEITPSQGPSLVEPDVIGLPCVAIVKNEVYDKKERNKVDELVASDALTGKSTKKAAAAGAKPAARRNLR